MPINHYLLIFSTFFLFLINISLASANKQINFDNQLIDAVEANDYEQAIYLLKSGINVNKRGKFQTTALIRAAYHNRAKLAAIILKNNADVELADLGQARALHIAARKNSLDVARQLITKKAQVDAKDIEGWTPIMRAINNQNLPMIELLIKAGAEIYQSNNFGLNAVDLAIQNKNYSLIQYLLINNKNQASNIVNKEELLNFATTKNDPIAVKLINELIIDHNNSSIDEIAHDHVSDALSANSAATQQISIISDVKSLTKISFNKPIKDVYKDYKIANEDIVELPKGEDLINNSVKLSSQVIKDERIKDINNKICHNQLTLSNLDGSKIINDNQQSNLEDYNQNTDDYKQNYQYFISLTANQDDEQTILTGFNSLIIKQQTSMISSLKITKDFNYSTNLRIVMGPFNINKTQLEIFCKNFLQANECKVSQI